MPAFIFDIETGPLSDEAISRVTEPFPPCQPYPDLQPFSPDAVKVGNLKDEAKIREKISAARASHESDYEAGKAAHLADWERKRAEYYASAKSRAALAAETGQVLAIGFASHEQIAAKQACSAENPSSICDLILIDHAGQDAKQGEAGLLQRFWGRYSKCVAVGATMIGFNSHGFDLPFLMRRSWLLGVSVPTGVLDKGRYWNPILVDLLAIWKCGQMGGANGSISLNRLALALGLEGKIGNGADFARLWAEDRIAAIDYARRDILITHAVATAMGVC